MIRPVAQVWFFREIQRTFEDGVSTDVLVDILGKFLLTALPIIVIFVALRYQEWLRFHLRRHLNMRRHPLDRARIGRFLQGRRIGLDIYLIGKKTNQFLCRANVTRYEIKAMTLGVFTELPGNLRRILSGKRVICFCRPFRVGGQRINSFTTYVQRATSGEGVVKSLILLTPAEYVYTPRRSGVRKRVARPEAVRVKLWGKSKKANFLHLSPDYETLALEDRQSWKPGTDVVNISSGGMRVVVYPKGGGLILRNGDEVVMELLIIDPAAKTYRKFLLLGNVRNIMRTPKGAMALGIQFTATGEQADGRKVEFTRIREDVKEIRALLESFPAKRSKEAD